MDQEGEWCLTEDFSERVMPKLREFQSMFWREIKARGTGHHTLKVGRDLRPEAQARAREIGLEWEEVFSFRLNSQERLIGVRQGAVFHILWDDKKHEVARSDWQGRKRDPTTALKVQWPTPLVRRIRTACAEQGVSIGDYLRGIAENALRNSG